MDAHPQEPARRQEDQIVGLVSTGETTLRSRRTRTAIEPDESYCVGSDAAAVPDLAIEVVWTNAMLDRLQAYARLGVKEVWGWEADRLRINILKGKRYAVVKHSRLFPTLDVGHFQGFVRKYPNPRALREYRASLRAH